MKLFTKYSRINIAATIVIFLAASTAFYFTLNFVLLHQIDDDLRIEQREITAYVKRYDRLPEAMQVKDQVIAYAPAVSTNESKRFLTVTLTEPHHKHREEYRQLRFTVQAAGQGFTVSVSKSLEDTDDLIHSVLIISFSTILLILAASAVINRYVLKKLWQPFYHSLDTVRGFRISKAGKPVFGATGIDEFRTMNETLENLTQQAQTDYLALKTFSENAAHEMQTPVAIIQSKLDLLIQDEALTERQSKTVQAVYDAILRLSRLNASLLLLAKIENKQFDEVQRLNLYEKLKEKTAEFEELWQGRQLQITASLSESFLTINPQLAEILLNNLLSNATKHNYSGGAISIQLMPGNLTVSNTSREPELNKDHLFQRFYKPSQSTDSHGLGLSLIKQICDVSLLTVRYHFSGDKHSFFIRWAE